LIFTHPQVSKRQIPQDILDGWKRHPVSAEKGPNGRELNTKGGQPVQGSSKMRPKPRPKKGLSCGATASTFADSQKLKLNMKTIIYQIVVRNAKVQGT